MLEKKWVFREQGDVEKIDELSKQLNINPVLSTLLIQRGITSFDTAKDYFRPSLEKLHNPFLMKDMDKAVERLNFAINNNENILIYGDYDVDGTTSVSMMYLFLKEIYNKNNIAFYIPDRYKEGYGLSKHGIEYAVEKKCALLITLDCGIKEVDLVNYAQGLNIDVIICDHHNQGGVLPNAVAVLDPKREDCNYPFKELSGCGVGFKLISALSSKRNLDLNKFVFKYLDLVAISIASDIVPIVDENRILAFYGLKKIAENPLEGVRQIKLISGLTAPEITINDLVFKIGPRINAAGRIESGESAVRLLIASDEHEAEIICSEIDICNKERKDIDHLITSEALEIIANSEYQLSKKTTVLFKEDWHKGVIGIVASRLTDYYYRPTVILTKSNGLITGSARSVDGFDLYKAIESCAHLLVSFGGHKYAAGLTLEFDKLDLFEKQFEKFVSENISEDLLTPKVHIDTVLELQNITPRFFNVLNQFQPFGPGNMNPTFASVEVEDIGLGKKVGKNEAHIKLSVKDLSKAVGFIDVIGFGLGHKAEAISQNKKFDICYSITTNTFRGETKLQLELKDIR
ncbi:MAG: single-stranded-DNA-specific exonuclease RecJ [Bacteroidales bacterium]|nr:single-stranded-DNA-specific exonuclease RecJ [Bacteroidales bacterium]